MHGAGGRLAVAGRGEHEGAVALDDLVEVAAGAYVLGEPGAEREVVLELVLLGRYPVTNAQMRPFVAALGGPVDTELANRLEGPTLGDHPATGVTFAGARSFCAWASRALGRRVRLPTGDEWEAAARGHDGRAWPWGPVFDPDRCACAEAGAWTTAPVTAHPGGAGPSGAEQLAGNVWEWVDDLTEDGDWRAVRGGCHLDHAWGLRASRSLPADPARATRTTGLRIAIDPEPRRPR